MDIFTTSLANMTTLIGYIGILVVFSPPLLVIMFISLIPQLFMQLKLTEQQFNLLLHNTSLQRQIFYLREILSTMPFVKELFLFNSHEYFLQKFIEKTTRINQAERTLHKKEIFVNLYSSVISALITAFSFFCVIIYAYNGYITLGDITLYLAAFAGVHSALSSSLILVKRLNEMTVFFSRYKTISELPPAVRLNHLPISIPKLEFGIEFKNVSFRYSDAHPWVIKNLNLYVPKGKKLALVGLNGSGKTTLVKLLTRLYDPTEGVILWDGINIYDFDIDQLRNRMGVIFQDFIKYDLSARENIGVGDISQITNIEQISRVINLVGMTEYIETLPQSYDTLITRRLALDDTAVDLSGGQWQKIAFARMFLRKAELLILDEPTSSLDAKSEYEIYGQFTNLSQEATTLLITHRFSTVQTADLIAVMIDGTITEYGSHDDLLTKDGQYATLYKLQTDRLSRISEKFRKE